MPISQYSLHQVSNGEFWLEFYNVKSLGGIWVEFRWAYSEADFRDPLGVGQTLESKWQIQWNSTNAWLFYYSAVDGGQGDDTLTGLDDTTASEIAAFIARNGLQAHFAGLPLYDAGADLLVGGSGDDWLNGRGGNDVLVGEGDNDTLLGGAGDDTLKGGAGSDLIDGGEGFDIAVFDGMSGQYLIAIQASGVASVQALGIDWLDWLRGVELLRFDDADIPVEPTPPLFTPDADRVRFDLLTAAQRRAVEGAPERIYAAGAGNDTVVLPSDEVLVAPRADYPFGVVFDRSRGFEGGAGDDSIVGSAARDLIGGGEGRDTLTGGGGRDTLLGGAGDDLLAGGGGADRLEGGDGADTLHGGSATSPNLSGADILFGGAGDDLLVGGDGDDSLVGGAGNDVFEIGDATGDKVIWGGQRFGGAVANDRDVIRLAGRPSDWAWTDWIADVEGTGRPEGWTTIARSGAGQSLELHEVELGLFDALRNNQVAKAPPVLEMARLALNSYADDVDAGTAPVNAATARGWAPLRALELGMDVAGATRDGTAWTFREGVYTAGNAAAHVLFGVVGNRTTLSIAFRGTDGLDDVPDWPNADTHYANFAPLIEAVKAYVNNGGYVDGARIQQVWVSGHSLGGAMAQMFMQKAVPGDPRYLGVTFGSPGAKPNAPDARMVHFEHIYDPVPLAPDLARAPAKLDDLAALAATAYLPLGAVVAELGEIALESVLHYRTSGAVVRLDWNLSDGVGGAHEMASYFRSVQDLVVARTEFPGGLDFLDPGALAAREVLHAGAGSDLLGAPPAFEQILRGKAYFDGAERFFGTLQADRLDGRAGADLLLGGRGADTLLGGAGDDTLEGGNGNDRLVGGPGADILTGGSGRDIFEYRNAGESTPSAPDTITDFAVDLAEGEPFMDRINLRPVDAYTPNGALDDSFVFIGTAAFTGAGAARGEVRVQQVEADTLVMLDTDADGVANMVLVLKNVAAASLEAADFLL
ncbi:hypothetical protein GCM10010964_31500 [Caldovatus sediminis]|uniref:Uncharacterized protein n=1 Tax=Caldovatus sediminis TaxID=2041189 RepID=A0A8J2ZD73_9PROT|nr:hypothetical protein [Caldovatus sediminis]GGG41655.1 hypothetical protein GCM10010964_31500 [Caldovatus sediminis]